MRSFLLSLTFITHFGLFEVVRRLLLVLYCVHYVRGRGDLRRNRRVVRVRDQRLPRHIVVLVLLVHQIVQRAVQLLEVLRRKCGLHVVDVVLQIVQIRAEIRRV